MNYYNCGFLIIYLTLFVQINAKEIIKAQSVNVPIPSNLYHGSPQARQLNEQIPVRLKVFGNKPNGPPKVVARYIPPLGSPRYYRPAVVGPAIRRRFQLPNGLPASMQQKRMTSVSYPASSYNKIKRYPTKSYKYPIYYKKKSGPGNFNSESYKDAYYQPQGPPLEAKISNNQGYHRMNFNKKKFYPSPNFDGKIIVKPPREQKYSSDGTESDGGLGKNQYTSGSSSYQYVSFPEHLEHQNKFKPGGRERDPSVSLQEYYQSKRHYGGPNYLPKQHGASAGAQNYSPYGKYSSYSVYDDSDNNEEENSESYVTESPVKYYVETTDSNTVDVAKKYLDFMSSSNYFLPKVSPDYHTKSIASLYKNFNVPTSTEPITSQLNSDLYENYKSHRINLSPGSSTGIKISSKISTSGGGGSSLNSNNNSGVNNGGNIIGNNGIHNVDSIIVGHHHHHHSNHQYNDNNDNNHQQQEQQNIFYRPSKKHQQIIHQQQQHQQQQHIPEKIEFTESDAIHSSYTSNPKEILDQSASLSLSSASSSLGGVGGVGGGGGGDSSSSIASAVDQIKTKYGLSPKYKVSYQSAKINHHQPHHHTQRVSKYQSDAHDNNSNNNNNDDYDNDGGNSDDGNGDRNSDDDVNEK